MAVGLSRAAFFWLQKNRRPFTIAAMAEHPATLTGAACILVVEDNEEMRILVAHALEDMGNLMLQAATVSAAREILGRSFIDLVLCDIHLGHSESGVALLHELAPRSPGVAVL